MLTRKCGIEAKHRGFAFVTYGSSADAQDAIDNMDLNEMGGKVLKVNLARPMKGQLQPGGNRAGEQSDHYTVICLNDNAFSQSGSPRNGYSNMLNLWRKAEAFKAVLLGIPKKTPTEKMKPWKNHKTVSCQKEVRLHSMKL